MKKKILIGVLILSVLSAMGYHAYITYRIFNFNKQQMVFNEYLDVKADCGVAVGADTRYQIIRDRGMKLYKANVVHLYNHDIPECKKLYSRYYCWMLDPTDDVSLDKCGAHFDYTKEEIEEMKKTHKLVERKNESKTSGDR